MLSRERGPWRPTFLTLTPSGISIPCSFISSYSARSSFVNPHFELWHTRCLPGNLCFARVRAITAWSTKLSLVRTDRSGWPILTLQTLPRGFPKAWRIPVWSLSAPAQLSILLMRSTCHGWTRTRRWKPSLPQFFTKYLLQAIRAASRASEDSYSRSKEIKCTVDGNISQGAFFIPASYIRILGSGTPRQNLDLG